jgi:hypothetical protein
MNTSNVAIEIAVDANLAQTPTEIQPLELHELSFVGGGDAIVTMG